MAVTAEMIAKRLAQTKGRTKSMAPTSAQTTPRPKPTDRTSAQAKVAPKANGQTSAQTRVRANSMSPTSAQAISRTRSTAATPAHLLSTIRLLGRTLDDLERLRIMNGNRAGAAQRRGIDTFWMAAVEPHLQSAEHAAELELKRAWRKHPLAKWAKEIPGAGEVLMGRLVAEIGEPHLCEVGHWEGEGDAREWVVDSVEPRTLAQLRAYCGHGDPARAGQIPKGATQEELFHRGSPGAKKALWKLSYQFMRTVGNDGSAHANSISVTRRSPRSPYRDVYEQRKQETEGKLHQRSCVRCGPPGKPALPGTPWSDAHRHADALRIVGKQFLRDLHEAAQTSSRTKSRTSTPAQTIEEAKPILATPAQASELTKSTAAMPAQAKTVPESNLHTPAQVTSPTKLKRVTPAQAEGSP